MAVSNPASISRVVNTLIDTLNASSWLSFPLGTIASTTTLLTVTNGVFTASDIGKQIQIQGAAASAGLYEGFITAFTSATQVTVFPSAQTSVTNVAVTYGGILDDDRRSLGNIYRAAVYGDSLVCRAIMDTPDQPFVNQFMGLSSALNHGDALPESAGNAVSVEIKFTGGTYKRAKPASFQQIEAYRANPDLMYQSIAHDAASSLISGYYHIDETRRIWFSGLNAQVRFASFSPTYSPATLQAPDVYEVVIADLALSRLRKPGDEVGVFEMAELRGQQGLALIRGGASMPEAFQRLASRLVTQGS